MGSRVPLPALSDGRVLLRAAESRDLPAIEAAIHDPDVIEDGAFVEAWLTAWPRDA